MESELEKAEQGVRNLVQDIKASESKVVIKIKHSFELAFEIALIVGFIYVVLWVCTHVLRW